MSDPVRGLFEWVGDRALRIFGTVGAINHFFWRSCYWAFVAPFRVRTLHRRQLFRMMEAVGYRSLGIVALVAFLVGIILVYNTGDVLERYGAIDRIAELVAVTLSRELGPLMTAIVIISRVGAAFSGGLGSMNQDDEIDWLQASAIPPMGYLVAPRLIALAIMMPCLTILALEIGIVGGGLVAGTQFHVPLPQFFTSAHDALQMRDLISGQLKSLVFALIIVAVSCYYGFTAEGGPEGVSRNTMVAAVVSLVMVIFADALVSAVFANYF
jgi:phospholipid/cholesterol/gamma-HCH transport system permease protein